MLIVSFRTCLKDLAGQFFKSHQAMNRFENSKASLPVSVPIMHVPSKSFSSPIIFSWIRSLQACHSRTRSCSTVTSTETSGRLGFGATIQKYFEISVSASISLLEDVPRLSIRKSSLKTTCLILHNRVFGLTNPENHAERVGNASEKIRWRDMIFPSAMKLTPS